jgi:hypothetical protein
LLNQKTSATGAKAPAAPDSPRPFGPLNGTSGPFNRTPDATGATIHTGRPSKVALRQKAATPDKIVQAFNTWAFKREQPDTPALLIEAVAGAVQLTQPVPFALYWGKGPRCALAEPDTTCLDYLASLGARVRQVYEPGASFKLIFTDTHATLNGHAAGDIAAYFADVGTAARQRGFDSCRLSDLVFAAESAGAVDLTDEVIPNDMLERLELCAAKWFRGEGSVEEGAARYLQMNMIEKRAVQFAFPRSIFITFNGSEFRSLFPDRMPIFYMYSLRRGMGVKPWFLPSPVVAKSDMGD